MLTKKVIIQDMEGASDEQLLKNLENCRKEIENYVKHKKHHTELVEMNKKRVALMEKMQAISDVKNAPLNPSYEFQKDPQWVALQSELLQLNSKAERQNLYDEIERLTGVIGLANDELVRFEEALPKIIAELEKRGVAYE